MYTYAGKVDIGVFEEQNDDRAYIHGTLISQGEFEGKTKPEEKTFLSMVCDGVGGLAKGYLAAEKTIEVVSESLQSGTVDADRIAYAIESANDSVRKLQLVENLEQGMRATIAGFYVEENGEFEKFYVFNAGDSRVYRLRFRYLTQLSKDHSLVQDMVDLGEITKEEAKNHPKKNVINKCIGHESVVLPRVASYEDDFLEGDILMICSDGISDEIDDGEIKAILQEYKAEDSLLDCCRAFYEKAIANGSKDNLSIVLVRKDSE